MNLTKTLRNQGYDLIGGPIRNQKLLQLWLKRPFSDIELYYSSIDHAFKSDVTLDKIENDALNVNATMKNEYKFNLGITLLEELLKSLGLGTFEVSSEIKSGKKVTISYDNSRTIEVPVGEIQTYLSDADFNHANRALLKNANRNNIIVISGILSAKNLVVEIETDFTLNADLTAKLNGIADGKLNFAIDNDHTLKMVSNTNNYFPIAVKADKIDFDNGHFDNTQLITDRRNLF